MLVICDSPRMSKTRRLIALSAETHMPIVCLNRDECERVFRWADSLCYRIPYPITIDQIMDLRGRQYKGVLVDNALDILQFFFQETKIRAVSIDRPHDSESTWNLDESIKIVKGEK